MKTLLALLSCIATTYIAVVALQSQTVPLWAAIAAVGLSLATLGAVCVHEVAAAMRICQVCQKPLQDRRAAGDYALKYGVRACDECGPKLDKRFHDDGPPERPPIPPYMQ